jgi:glycine betaine/proline transport system substrate-binding protein
MKPTCHLHRWAVPAALAIMLAWALGLAAAADAQGWPPPLGKDKIVYVHASWDTSASMSTLAKILLEQMGYKVELKLVDTGLAYQALASGTGDVWSSAWLPGQQPYLNKHGDKLDILSMSYLPVPGGLAVPGYVPIATVDDLKKPDVKKRLGGKILGIDAGSGIMLTTEKLMKAYGLDYELVPSSVAAMEAAFRAAYTKNEWVAVVTYCPTAMCAKYEVKFLQDAKGIYSEYRDFHVTRRGFRTDSPRAVAFYSRFTLHETQISKMVLWMSDGMKAEQAARRFMEQNPELIWYWVGDLIPNFPKPASLQ